MLPPGHIAGGYLAGKLASLAIPELNQPDYLAFSAFFGFFPDLDFFIAFAKSKKMTIDDSVNHHKFVTHAPFLYLVLFSIFYLLFPEHRLYAWAFIIGTWSHLLIDTFFSDGTAWLYPFSGRLFGKNSDQPIRVAETDFWKHWTQFIKEYFKLYAFKAEVALIIIALAILFTTY